MPLFYLGQNQKQRILALEAVAAQTMEVGYIRPTTQTPPKSDSAESSSHHAHAPYMSTCPTQLDLSPPEHDTITRDSDYIFGPGTGTSSDTFVSASNLRHSQPALHAAIRTGNKEMVRLLLKNRADVARQDSDGNSALHVAAGLGRDDLVSMLLDHVASVDMVNYLGQTPLFMAVQSGCEAVVIVLLDGGADIHIKDSIGNSPLHQAVHRESIPIATLLLARGANVDD